MVEKIKMNKQAFLTFFNSNDFHEIMDVEDCHHIFKNVLHGSSDFTGKLLRETISDYSAGIEVIDPEESDFERSLSVFIDLMRKYRKIDKIEAEYTVKYSSNAIREQLKRMSPKTE